MGFGRALVTISGLALAGMVIGCEGGLKYHPMDGGADVVDAAKGDAPEPPAGNSGGVVGSGTGGSSVSSGGTGVGPVTGTGGTALGTGGSPGASGGSSSTGGGAGGGAPGGATVTGSGGLDVPVSSGGATGIGGRPGTATGGGSGGPVSSGGMMVIGGRPGTATGGAGSGGTVGSGGDPGTGGSSCQPKPRDCTSSLDNDCNGTPDNSENAHCKCKSGTAQACGNSGQAGIGICRAGSQTCQLSTDKTTSDWGTCSGAVTPKARDCTSSADNDCNGTVDSQETASCKCQVGTTQPCQGNSTSPAKGICKYGTQTCSASSDKTTSSWSTSCVGSVGPKTRDCASTVDNDCSGTADNLECYGTTVVAGTVTCGGGEGKKQCSASSGCGWVPRVDNPAGSCGNPGAGNYYMTCDGPNDCPGGVCCSHFNGFFSGGLTCYGGNQSGIGGCPPDDTEAYALVCDPLNDKCPAGYHCLPLTDATAYWALCVAN